MKHKQILVFQYGPAYLRLFSRTVECDESDLALLVCRFIKLPLRFRVVKKTTENESLPSLDKSKTITNLV